MKALRSIIERMLPKAKWGINLKRVSCPQCAMPQPLLRMPKTVRQAAWGGLTCKHCGCEMDKWGHRVDA